MKLISFAYDFISYLLQNIKNNKISRIFLFGSVIREEATKDSDIDIFIETSLKQEEINKILDKFYKSSKYTKYWKPLNIKNQIKAITGSLDDFPELKRSIIGNGLILYSPYKEKIKGNNYSLFKVEFKGKFKDKVSLWRKLYGYTQKRDKKVYTSKGIIEEHKGKKIAKSIFLIPIENTSNVIKELKKLKIKYQVFDISSDTL